MHLFKVRFCDPAEQKALGFKRLRGFLLPKQPIRFRHGAAARKIFPLEHRIDDLIQIPPLALIALAEHAIPVHAERFIKADTHRIVRINIQPKAIHAECFKRKAHRSFHCLTAIPLSFCVDRDAAQLEHLGLSIQMAEHVADVPPILPAEYRKDMSRIRNLCAVLLLSTLPDKIPVCRFIFHVDNKRNILCFRWQCYHAFCLKQCFHI